MAKKKKRYHKQNENQKKNNKLGKIINSLQTNS